jgi:hypothetical protein
MPKLLPLDEFRSAWLPHVSDRGLDRLIELLRSGNPLLIRGTFATAIPRGCLASHIAWNHPRTQHLDEDAGIVWLTKIAGLNPATSRVILAWDEAQDSDWSLRHELLAACEEEQALRVATRSAECAISC